MVLEERLRLIPPEGEHDRLPNERPGLGNHEILWVARSLYHRPAFVNDHLLGVRAGGLDTDHVARACGVDGVLNRWLVIGYDDVAGRGSGCLLWEYNLAPRSS